MKLYIYKSKSNTTFYMVKAYRTSEGKSTSKIVGIGYKQLYQKNEITTALNNNYTFNIDQEFIGIKNLKKFLKF